MEGNLSIIDEDNSNEQNINNFENCIKINIWDKINESVNSVVDSLTLEDLMSEYTKLNDKVVEMYYI